MELGDAFGLMRKYSIDVVPSIITDSADEAISFCKGKYPVAVKMASAREHKTDIGGVKLYINSEKELSEAFADMQRRFKGKVLVQKMVRGAEIIIGVKTDPQFGKLIMLGIGGIYVEIYKDVSLRVCPVDKKDVLEMIEELKGKKVLSEYRGKKVNREAVVDAVIKMGKLALKEGIKEIEVNPAIATAEKCYVVDVRVNE
ncbi:MAG: acetate--CoA ligase family protein [Candidatus Anstonellales archaeon]